MQKIPQLETFIRPCNPVSFSFSGPDSIIKLSIAETIAFYIDTIFCRPDGGNLRNKVAHGLISTATSLNPIVPFTWWFLLRFAVLAKIKKRE